MKGGEQMELNELMQAITTVGFPVVMCGAMCYYVKYITDKHREEIDRVNTNHTKELSKITAALNNNTLALTKLCERMDNLKDEKTNYSSG